MTLGCGAIAGNATSDNIGPMNLINIKRLAYAAREADDAFEAPLETSRTPWAPIDRRTVSAAVDRYLAARGLSSAEVTAPVASNLATQVVNRFLSRRSSAERAGFG